MLAIICEIDNGYLRTVSKGWIETERRKLQSCVSRRQSTNRDRPKAGKSLFHASSLAIYILRFFTLLMTFGSSYLFFDFNFRHCVTAERTNFREIHESCMSLSWRIENILRAMFYVNIYYFLISSDTFKFSCLKSPYIEIFITTWIFRH